MISSSISAFASSLLMLLMVVSHAVAQVPARPTAPPVPTGISRLKITPMPGQVPGSLKELIASSVLVAEGRVEAVLPARETSPGSLETDAVLTITSVIKGDGSSKTIVVCQRGGTLGPLTVMPIQYSMVEAGKSYLLFLTEDWRTGIPKPAISAKRYLITGIWSGLFYFENGRMRVLADHPDKLRATYMGLSRQQVLTEISQLIKN